MAKKKISATEKKLRSELRADQNRLKKLENQVSTNFKFGTEGAGKQSLILNKRIEERKQKLKRFGYKGKKEIDWKKRAKKINADEKFNFRQAWFKKDSENEIFKVIKPKSINGKSLKTDLNGAITDFNKQYLNMTSKDTLKGVLSISGDLILYKVSANEEEEEEEEE